jgi:hypothetical protein
MLIKNLVTHDIATTFLSKNMEVVLDVLALLLLVMGKSQVLL